MDKNAIKKYAVWARRELIEKVSQKALQYGIEDGGVFNLDLDSVNGVLLSPQEKKQRLALINKIKNEGYAQVIEEVAYTWFNRFIALRFMEVNGYLPSHIRLFTDENNEFKPQVLAEALHLDLKGLDQEKVLEMKSEHEDEKLFKYLIILQCNELSEVLPELFQELSDYSELLIPDYLLRKGSVIEQMITMIPEDNWNDQVQIIGWLYQYYNSEPKNDVFASLVGSKKIAKEDVPAATQLFTPDWVVKYMVDNSLVKLWEEAYPNTLSKEDYAYYVKGEQSNAADKSCEKHGSIRPEDLKCIDPCMGSGHVLVYMFDVLIKIYESYGYSSREAAESIVKNNLFGADLDERAAQLSSFSIMMKARQYDRRILQKGVRPNVIGLQGLSLDAENINNNYLRELINSFEKIDEYGSLSILKKLKVDEIRKRVDSFEENLFTLGYRSIFNKMLFAYELLTSEYDVVVTNPPYMSGSNMSPELSKYVKKNYPDSKADLFACFIDRVMDMTRENGYMAMITQHSWMFLSSYESLRRKIFRYRMVNMAHLGPRAFDEIGGEVVQTTSFVINKVVDTNFEGTYIRLVEPTSEEEKRLLFLSGNNRYVTSQNNFAAIPGNPVAYWIDSELIKDFEKGIPFSEVGFPKVGMQTSNNDKFLRLWYEVKPDEFYRGDKKWIKYVKGGSYRRWYGNLEYVVWYNNDPDFILQQKNARVLPESELETLKCTWTDLATSRYSSRVAPRDSFHDISGHCFYPSEENYYYLLAYTNSKVFQNIIDLLNSSLHYQVGDVARTPVLYGYKEEIERLAKRNVEIAKEDWDSFETSWDFKCCPLINGKSLEDAYEKWSNYTSERVNELKRNEERLNALFIEIYGLGETLNPEVKYDDITIRKADREREVKDLISYAVGCMFGRYSLKKEGIVLGSNELLNDTLVDEDNIIPICDDEYFHDDIVEKLIEFLKEVYPDSNVDDDLQFIADSLGGKGTSREIIRNYFLNDFYKDHLKKYQKRPIYWQFDSGKKNGFKALAYYHRYQNDLAARVRTDYVHEQQSRYRTAIEEIEQRLINTSGTEKVKLEKKLKMLKEQTDEIHSYEEKIHHIADKMLDIDIDNGIVRNYELFKDVLAKIK